MNPPSLRFLSPLRLSLSPRLSLKRTSALSSSALLGHWQTLIIQPWVIISNIREGNWLFDRVKKKKKEKKPDACTHKGKSQSACQIHTSHLFSLLLIISLILPQRFQTRTVTSPWCSPLPPKSRLYSYLLSAVITRCCNRPVSQWGSLASNLIWTNLIVIIENRVVGSRWFEGGMRGDAIPLVRKMYH